MDNCGDETLILAVRKKALGYTAKESVEEYALIDGEMQLVKRKVSIKDVPPDVAAARLLLDGGSSEDVFDRMTDEELEAERRRLVAELKATLKKEKERKTHASGEGKVQNRV